MFQGNNAKLLHTLKNEHKLHQPADYVLATIEAYCTLQEIGGTRFSGMFYLDRMLELFHTDLEHATIHDKKFRNNFIKFYEDAFKGKEDAIRDTYGAQERFDKFTALYNKALQYPHDREIKPQTVTPKVTIDKQARAVQPPAKTIAAITIPAKPRVTPPHDQSQEITIPQHILL